MSNTPTEYKYIDYTRKELDAHDIKEIRAMTDQELTDRGNTFLNLVLYIDADWMEKLENNTTDDVIKRFMPVKYLGWNGERRNDGGLSVDNYKFCLLDKNNKCSDAMFTKQVIYRVGGGQSEVQYPVFYGVKKYTKGGRKRKSSYKSRKSHRKNKRRTSRK